VNADTAQMELLALGETELGKKYPAALAGWERAWDRFTPFLAFPPPVRKVIYTTNAMLVFSSGEIQGIDLRRCVEDGLHDAAPRWPEQRFNRGRSLVEP